MPVNEFLPFATQPGANVASQTAYSTDPTTGVGFAAGIALSAKLNKVWRQSTFVAAAVAQLAMEEIGEDILDNGDLAALVDQLRRTVKTLNPRKIAGVDTGTVSYTNFYVDPLVGNDTNDGLTPLTAWKTIQHATNWLIADLDFNNSNITVHLAPGTYNTSWIHSGNPVGCFSPSQFVYQGDAGNPDSVVIQGSSSTCVYTVNGAMVTFRGMRFVNSAGGGIEVAGASNVRIDAVDFGPCTGGSHLTIDTAGFLNLDKPYMISGGAIAHLSLGSAALLGTFAVSPFNVSLVGTPHFTAFIAAQMNANANIAHASMVYVGGATGTRYTGGTGAIIATNGGGANYFPGDAPGSVDASTFAVYN